MIVRAILSFVTLHPIEINKYFYFVQFKKPLFVIVIYS